MNIHDSNISVTAGKRSSPVSDPQEAHGGAMPAYFRFLTILAFHVFLQEKVSEPLLPADHYISALTSPSIKQRFGGEII